MTEERCPALRRSFLGTVSAVLGISAVRLFLTVTFGTRTHFMWPVTEGLMLSAWVQFGVWAFWNAHAVLADRRLARFRRSVSRDVLRQRDADRFREGLEAALAANTGPVLLPLSRAFGYDIDAEEQVAVALGFAERGTMGELRYIGPPPVVRFTTVIRASGVYPAQVRVSEVRVPGVEIAAPVRTACVECRRPLDVEAYSPGSLYYCRQCATPAARLIAMAPFAGTLHTADCDECGSRMWCSSPLPGHAHICGKCVWQ